MGIVYLLIILSLAVICLVLKTGGLHHSYLWLDLIYGWIPGILGLLWAHINKIKISLFPKFDRYFLVSISGGFFLGALSFFIGLRFCEVDVYGIVGTGNAFTYFFSYYVLFLFLFFISLLGGEVCWRGYLWEKWKNDPYKGGGVILLLWSLWNAPLTIAYSKSLFEMFLHNLALMAVLHLFRKKSQSIGPGTLFCSSLYASFIYFQMLFSSSQVCYLNYHFVIQDALLLTTSGVFIILSRKTDF